MGALYFSGESYKQLVTGWFAIEMVTAINNFGNEIQLKQEWNNTFSSVRENCWLPAESMGSMHEEPFMLYVCEKNGEETLVQANIK